MSGSSPRTPYLLVVSQDLTIGSALAAALGTAVQVRQLTDAAIAEALIIARPLDGAVLDLDLLGAGGIGLARTFARCQPVGRVVLVEGESGAWTLMGLSLRDERIGLFSRPLDIAEVCEYFRKRVRKLTPDREEAPVRNR